MTYRKNWGEERIYFHDEAGRLRSVPASWTDLFPPDPFHAVAAGRAYFRPRELLQLAQLLAALRLGLNAEPSHKRGSDECK